MVTQIHFPVRDTEIDSWGIVHHSNYPKWFERGRLDFFEKADIPSSKMKALGLLLPLTQMRCDYKNPARYGDEILVITSLTQITCVKLRFEYRVLNNFNGKTLSLGNTIHAWTNKNIEPLNVEKEYPEIYWLLMKFIE